jgi:hypothetical protein
LAILRLGKIVTIDRYIIQCMNHFHYLVLEMRF